MNNNLKCLLTLFIFSIFYFPARSQSKHNFRELRFSKADISKYYSMPEFFYFMFELVAVNGTGSKYYILNCQAFKENTQPLSNSFPIKAHPHPKNPGGSDDNDDYLNSKYYLYKSTMDSIGMDGSCSAWLTPLEGTHTKGNGVQTEYIYYSLSPSDCSIESHPLFGNYDLNPTPPLQPGISLHKRKVKVPIRKKSTISLKNS